MVPPSLQKHLGSMELVLCGVALYLAPLNCDIVSAFVIQIYI